MTSVASISSTTIWIPEDDLLLKNAVEAGASLESLAKGAVKFSRKFTFHELRDRWHSLLYDPDISAQASARMVELELSGSTFSSKFNKSENNNVSEDVPEKRKIGSLRRQYYAMQKRLRREFFDSTDMGVLAEPNFHDCSGNGDFEDPVTLDNVPRNGDCISNHFQFHEMDFDVLHNAFPEAMRDMAATTSVENADKAFHSECVNPVEVNSNPDRIVGKDCLYRVSEDVSSSLIKDDRGSFEPNIEREGMPHTLDDNSSNFVNCLGVADLDPSQALPKRKHYEANNFEVKLLSPFDLMDDNPQNVCSGFGGKQQFNSSDSDGSASRNRMGLSSPLPSLPLWKTMEDISAPAMPISVSQGDTIQRAEKTPALPHVGDGNRSTILGYSVEPLRDKHNGMDFINSTAVSDGEFADISYSLLNFSNEDEVLCAGVDAKNAMDGSCYDNINSLLVSSPNVVQQADVVEPKTSIFSKTCLVTPIGSCPAESENITSSIHVNQQSFCHSDVKVQSTLVLNPNPRELSDINMYCTLNTEDPDIPCNDDIFLLIHPSTLFASSAPQPFAMDSIDQASSSINQMDSEQRRIVMKKGRDPAQAFAYSQMGVPKPSMTPRLVPGHPLLSCAVKSELPDTNFPALPALGDPSQCRSVNAIPKTAADGVPEKNVTKAELTLVDPPAMLRNIPLQAVGSVKISLQESAVNPSTLNQEESESDDDVPYFSDIEAVILGMDLDPHDQDLHISRKVSRYQSEDSKKTIARLEQCARSSLQRAMTSQGALAILYGRHMKHYIRKTEVLLGRSTDEIDVDIDLRKEGRANKISRRQAIIKMETDGSFFLKNLGKSLISVNGKSVAIGQFLSLTASCLIEIRGMSFVFEINEKYLRRYLDNIATRGKGKNSNFEWSPEGEP